MELTCCLSGCHNKISQSRWLEQQTLIFHSSGDWEVPGQHVRRFSSWWGPWSCFVDGDFSMCAHTKGTELCSLPLRKTVLLSGVPPIGSILRFYYRMSWTEIMEAEFLISKARPSFLPAPLTWWHGARALQGALPDGKERGASRETPHFSFACCHGCNTDHLGLDSHSTSKTGLQPLLVNDGKTKFLCLLLAKFLSSSKTNS